MNFNYLIQELFNTISTETEKRVVGRRVESNLEYALTEKWSLKI
jgi:hypothetical protein